MVDSLPKQILSADNQRSLKSLQRAISLSSGRRFSLILAHCNYAHLQAQIMEKLRQEKATPVKEIAITSTSHTLYTAIKSKLQDETPTALVITNFENNTNIETLLVAANQVREEFRKQFICPLVLWVTDDVLTQMVRLAPDFYSWATSPISFQLSSLELQTFLRQQTDELFVRLLNPSNNAPVKDLLLVESYKLCPREAKAARHDLQAQKADLAPDLDASLQFVLAQESHQKARFQKAIEQYQGSLQFWQDGGHLKRQGIVQFFLGQSYLVWGESESLPNESHFVAAEQFFRDCLATFERTNRLDLKAKYISYQGDALKYLNRWDDLQSLLLQAQTLIESYPDPIEQAKLSGLNASLNLKHTHNYPDAVKYSQNALQLLTNNPEKILLQGRYSLLLAEALQSLQQPQKAINVLRQIRDQFRPEENTHRHIQEAPRLYIEVLERLRELYFEQKQYRQAFHFKREQWVIESQYGLRAFVGAGRLRPNRQKHEKSDSLGTIAEEIIVSGRHQDLENLKERISRNDCVLTILHGQLGVGKSSLIQAGLIPTLEEEPIKARDTLVILLKTYLNWEVKLKRKLASQLRRQRFQFPTSLSAGSALIEQLQENEQNNLTTVLIFDQFEEFFVSCTNSLERKMFFDFLSQCLEIPFIRVVLSLREDFLHHLLEWERYDALECIGDNILSNHHRYGLVNFSTENAKTVVQGLTERSQFTLESELIDCLVQDLAEEEEEIRPIELQVVGAQLHEQKIRTLEQYKALEKNPKEVLVQNYLEGVIQDCGPENRQTAELILYVLTGENNTRPSKTREELETDLRALEKELLPKAEKIDLVLKIFEQSGLIFLLPESPSARYQLVHDYLVEFIRRQQPRIDKLVKELEKNRIQLKKQEEELKILQLEAKVSEEIRKREKEELRNFHLEAEQEAMISARKIERRNTIIATTTLALLGLGALLGWSRYNWKLSESFNRQPTWAMIKEFNSFNQLSLTIQDEPISSDKLALIAAIEASYRFNLAKEDVRRIAPEDFEEDEKTVRNTANLLQEAIKENLSNHEMNMARKEDQSILFLDIAGLPIDDLHDTLNKLRRVACSLILSPEFSKSEALVKIIEVRKIDGKCEPEVLIQPLPQ